MAIRVKHKINVRVAEDTNMDNMLFGPKDDLAEVILDSYEKTASGNFTIAAGQTEALAMGDVGTVCGIYLRVDGDCQMQLNEAGPFQLKRGSTIAGATAKFAMEGLITSLSLTAGAGDLHGVFCVWGLEASPI